ncbi:MAG TPA: cell envelope integrity protein TolA [Steroidobacteraceae bacterium]|jgi:colicin import membrane protein|nr:cell envelope integrity protein TolA [Steroidobacteraceae bacterium]
MTERRSDRVLSIVLSILIHAAIVGVLLWGWFQYRRPTATVPSLAIEATVVRNAPPATQPPSPPANPPPEPANPPPPVPSAEEQAAQQARADEAARQKAQEQQRAAQEKRSAEEQAEQQRQREQAERAAAEKAEAERAAAAKAEAERAAAAKAEADRKAQQLAQQRKAEQERAQREADLRSQMASEEHINAVQSSPAKAEYLSLITARINRAWIRPASARPGVKCLLHITQIPGGEITHVVVAGCNGDEAVRQSVETAAYRASPLPAPSDPALFDPNIDVTFAPDE